MFFYFTVKYYSTRIFVILVIVVVVIITNYYYYHHYYKYKKFRMKELALIGYITCAALYKEAQQTWFFLSHIAIYQKNHLIVNPQIVQPFTVKKL